MSPLNARLTIAPRPSAVVLQRVQHIAQSMSMLAIQFIASAALRAAGEADAPWDTHYQLRGVDYSSYASVDEAAKLLALDADGAYQYRIVEVASVADSYLELRAENEDALEALAAWVEAGCPRTGESIEDLRRLAIHCADAAPVTPARETEAA